jgi:SOS-response transcriptional repressor LexA
MSFHQTKLKALDYIRSHTLAKGEAPSMREIAHGIGQASPGSVHRMVAALEAEGKLRRMPGKRRSIELVPVSGTIAVELPPYLYAEVEAVARHFNVTLAAVVIEAVRDGFRHLPASSRSKISRETSGAGNGATHTRDADR